MKNIIVLLIILSNSMITLAQMDLPSTGFNPRATISEEVGITSITIKYSRPGVKNREGKIWGERVPYGFGTFNFVTSTMSSPWRAGANEVTVISFEHDVSVEGKNLPAGSYALFMALEQDSVLLIFSDLTDAWGSFYYKPDNDVLRVKVKSIKMDRPIEWLKYEFIEHKEKSCMIAMQWEKLSVPFKVDVDVHKIVLARIREEFTGVKGFISANKLQAAMYCFNEGINMEEAMSWAKSAVTGKPFGQSAFNAYELLAEGYEILKQLPQADSVMNIGLAIASIDQYTAYGRKLLGKKRIDPALKIMMDARSKFGDVFQVTNGLSYAYSAKGDFKKALEFANKSLMQAPPPFKPLIESNIAKLKDGKDINQK